MKDLKSEQPGGKHPTLSSSPNPPAEVDLRPTGGFAKVIAGGRIVRPDPTKPEVERMVTGSTFTNPEVNKTKSSHAMAVLESVTANLEAGIGLVDRQETALAKIGGKLSEIALILNQSKSPKATQTDRMKHHEKFIYSRDQIEMVTDRTMELKMKSPEV